MRCKECKHFDNSKPVSTSTKNDKYKRPEKYIGTCKITSTIKMANDLCYKGEKENE